MATVHPLDPLTSIEISQSSRLIRKFHPNENGWIFNSVALLEPPKKKLLPFLLDNGKYAGGIPRRSFTILIEKGTGTVYEAVVNLMDETVERFESVTAGHQPTLTPEDCFESERIVKADLEVQRRCTLLGLNNMDLVVADPWYGKSNISKKR